MRVRRGRAMSMVTVDGVGEVSMVVVVAAEEEDSEVVEEEDGGEEGGSNMESKITKRTLRSKPRSV